MPLLLRLNYFFYIITIIIIEMKRASLDRLYSLYKVVDMVAQSRALKTQSFVSNANSEAM